MKRRHPEMQRRSGTAGCNHNDKNGVESEKGEGSIFWFQLELE